MKLMYCVLFVPSVLFFHYPLISNSCIYNYNYLSNE